MTDPARSEVAGPLRPADGLCLLGEFRGSGFAEPRFLVRRGDGQVIQLSRLLYLVAQAVAEGGGGRDAGEVATQVAAGFGRDITADNVRYLVTGKLAPLGVVLAGDVPGEPGQAEGRADPGPAPRSDLLLGLRLRGVLLRPRAAAAVGRSLAWLHYPVLTALLLAGFAAFEGWLFAVHGAVGPLLSVLRHPILFLALAGLTLASLLFHEFGHASACRYGGARPGVIGFGLYLIWPSLYTDVTDVYRLGRGGRLRTDLGGVYFNAVFILILAGCYAATGQPVLLAAAFLDNFQILQQIAPLVRLDGYFILADLAGVPDLLGLLGPIMISLLPAGLTPPAWASAGARARALRRGPRILVTTWVLVAVPLLAALAGYTVWHLPSVVATAARSFTTGFVATRAEFAAGHFAGGLDSGLSLILLVLPLAGLAYLVARIAARGIAALARFATGPDAATRRARLVPVVAGLAAMTAAAGGTLVLTGTIGRAVMSGPAAGALAAANRAQAAAWVTGQVGVGVTVACDPAMCGQVRDHGFPAARLVTLTSTTSSSLGPAVLVATPALREEFGPQLTSGYAPLVLASFGSGAGRVEVRAVASDGAAAFRSQLAADHTALVSAGQQLLRNRNLQAAPAAQAALRAGRTDSRLLATLSVLAAQMPIRLVALDGQAPGASPEVPLRSAQISVASPSAQAAIMAFLRAQQAPYQPAAITTTRSSGQPVVTIRFDVAAT